MNINRFKAKFEGLNTAARKVYNAVPISEPWDISQILRELERSQGRMDYRVVHGCLTVLTDIGLVIETEKEYRRTPVRERTEKTPEPKEEPVMKIETKPAAPAAAIEATQSPMDILAGLASRLIALGNDFETAALTIQAQHEAREKDMEKFRQLQALLKGM